MRIATWNVNSIRSRWNHLKDWLNCEQPDAVCLQETRVEDEKFPRDDIHDLGYHCVFTGQKSFHGVAILSRRPLSEVQYGFSGCPANRKGIIESRVVSGTLENVRLVCVYIPNGGSGKLDYKLDWLEAFCTWLAREVKKYPRLIVMGDFNILASDQDAYNWPAFTELLGSPAERALLAKMLNLGLTDLYRHLHPDDKGYTWWHYLHGDFRANRGLRLDYVLVSPALLPSCSDCTVDIEPRDWDKPSDHAPILTELN